AGTLAVAQRVPGLAAAGVADPRRAGPEHLARVEEAVAAGQVKALVGYLGYLPQEPGDVGYRPYYELAQRHRLPVVLHTGDTRSTRARLRSAHPLLVDEVAVDHPGVSFVLVHFGN